MFNFQPSPEMLKQLLGSQMSNQMPPTQMPPQNMGMPMQGLDTGMGMSNPMPMPNRQMMPPPMQPNPMPPMPNGGNPVGGMMQRFAQSKKRI